MWVSPARAGSLLPGVLELKPLACILFCAPFYKFSYISIYTYITIYLSIYLSIFKKFDTAIMVIFGPFSSHLTICHKLVSLPLRSCHWGNGEKLFFEKSRASLHASIKTLKLAPIISFLTITTKLFYSSNG